MKIEKPSGKSPLHRRTVSGRGGFLHKKIFFRVYIARRRDRDVRCFELAFASCAERRCILSLVARVAAQNGGRSADARHHRGARCDFKWLSENGYTAVLSEDLINYTESGAALPEKPILLTFDDGYYNNYLYAYPTAKRYGMKFVLSPIGKYADLYTETPDKSPYYAHCTWDMLREMQSSGVVEIANHTYDLHSSDGARLGTKQLSGESLEDYTKLLTEDVTLFQQKAEENLQSKPVLFAYPFGAVSKGEPEIIKNLGFKVTLSCEERVSTVTRAPESLYYLGRYLRPSGVSSESFFEHILKA